MIASRDTMVREAMPRRMNMPSSLKVNRNKVIWIEIRQDKAIFPFFQNHTDQRKAQVTTPMLLFNISFVKQNMFSSSFSYHCRFKG